MALALTSALVALSVSVTPVPGITLTQTGFRSTWPGSDEIKFARPISFRRQKSPPFERVFTCGSYAGTPQTVRVSDFGAGFEMYCPLGIDYRLSTLQAPTLTVAGSSYGPDTPTPRTTWVLMTFADRQPPVLLTFSNPCEGLMVSGRAGEWRLKGQRLYKGWVKVVLPLGLTAASGNDVTTLGELAKRVQEQLPWLSHLAPTLVSKAEQAGQGTVSVTWRFDGPGAVVNPTLVFARAGGYGLEFLTPVHDSGSATEDGPLVYVNGQTLKVSLPVGQVPQGRAVTLGQHADRKWNITMPPTIAQCYDLALECLLGGRSAGTATLATHISAELSLRPGTDAATGTPIDEAAAYALVDVAALGEPRTEASRYLMAVTRRQSERTFMVEDPDPVRARRASALGCVALLLERDVSSVTRAALMQAGLSAAIAKASFQRKRGLPVTEVPAVEPLWPVRRAFFWPSAENVKRSPVAGMLMSPLRILGPEPVEIAATDSEATVSWTGSLSGPSTLSLICARTFGVRQGMGQAPGSVSHTGDTLQLRGLTDKTHKSAVRIVAPSLIAALPLFTVPEPYSERPSPDRH